MAGHQPLRSIRLYASVLHFLYHLLHVCLPQSATMVSSRSISSPMQLNLYYRPFTIDWWAWLALTGVSIGCVARYDFPGDMQSTQLMCIQCQMGRLVRDCSRRSLHSGRSMGQAWRPSNALRESWRACSSHELIRNHLDSQRTYLKHLVARVLCLIVLPFAVYMFCFKLHFLILNRSGPGDAQMSSLFQAHLHGNDFANNPLEPTYGSKLTLKNMGYGGGLLHSHASTYPSGSKQQQVTCYHYKGASASVRSMNTADDPVKTTTTNGSSRLLGSNHHMTNKANFVI